MIDRIAQMQAAVDTRPDDESSEYGCGCSVTVIDVDRLDQQ